MAQKKLEGAGLRGQVAGKTSLCTVGKEGAGLTYRGFSIELLAEKATFEEVAHLLLYGHLPNKNELESYKEKLINMRSLPEALKEVLERIPSSTHPMDVLRTGCSMLGNLEPEGDFLNQNKSADRMLAAFPSIIIYWYRFSHDGVKIDVETDDDSIAGHFLNMLLDKKPSDNHKRCLDVSLMLYAEHEFNASTFTARVTASTLSDIHSCVTGAIGSLRGPLHGGANEEAMEMIKDWKTPAEAKENILGMLERKDKIMGFGHAIYTDCDPRNAIIKEWSKKLSEEQRDTVLYAVSEEVEKVMWEEKKLFCNADFFHASAYNFLGIPTKLFTPIFVLARLTGWAAHIMEQRADNRIIRPIADYVGPENPSWVDLSDR
jgi:2-methylcitrate synthase